MLDEHSIWILAYSFCSNGYVASTHVVGLQSGTAYVVLSTSLVYVFMCIQFPEYLSLCRYSSSTYNVLSSSVLHTAIANRIHVEPDALSVASLYAQFNPLVIYVHSYPFLIGHAHTPSLIPHNITSTPTSKPYYKFRIFHMPIPISLSHSL
jgi:hypothetical protein